MTSSALVQLPSLDTPIVEPPKPIGVGINKDGELYSYGPTQKEHGPVMTQLRGLATDLQIVRLGVGGIQPEGRDYLRLTMMTGIGYHALQLPCDLRISKSHGQLTTPSHVRTLLAGLQCLDLPVEAFSLRTKRGDRAFAGVFFEVFPFHDGTELPKIFNPPIGTTRNDLEIAVNGLRQALGLPPQFTSPYDELQS